MTDTVAKHDREIVPAVRAALLRHRSVLGVELVGSRADGRPVPLSDWDFVVRVEDFRAVAADLPSLVSGLEPLAQQWDRLGEPSYSCYMLMLAGPRKVDLIFDTPHTPEPPWTVTRDTLEGIDGHFWDWILWLASKRQRGEDELVSEQLGTMTAHLLRPLGVERVPASIEGAIRSYRGARDRLESELHVSVPRRLEAEVLRVVPI
ncbi:MAG TPA: hypothetical protein VFK59_05325 [Actinomycetota bacterium]|nr:hypothetical protein [Actinomycetota bacterium]